ncbi:hypothetical protein CRUP_033589 [Coryphaenoides rupestris]|nr:hypothetical protein CRUP_033589 [Coryphaenoides rupestris]
MPSTPSEAREVCHSLGLTIASKAQVQSAITQGYQTCRFGWIDEHFAVIPRVTAEVSCGQGKTGLVSSVDGSHRLQYAFNASEAREVCHSLGLTIASKAQVQSAITQGYQTCSGGERGGDRPLTEWLEDSEEVGSEVKVVSCWDGGEWVCAW